MNNKRLKSILFKEIEENFLSLILIILFLAIGIVLGIYTVKYMQTKDMNNLKDYLSVFLEGITNKSFSSKSLIYEAIRNNLIIILIIWSFGLTFLGIPAALFANLVKGYTFGFSLAFLIAAGGEKALLLSLVALLPQNIIYFVSIVIVSMYAFKSSLIKLQSKFYGRSSKLGSQSSIPNYMYSLAVVLLIMIIGLLIEAYITPIAIKYIVSV